MVVYMQEPDNITIVPNCLIVLPYNFLIRTQLVY